MAQFDESKVINVLHPEKAEIGKKYLFADDIVELKVIVESGAVLCRKLSSIQEDGFYYLDALEMPFRNFLIYPYEEPPKKRMTRKQLAEWLAKGNGQVGYCQLDNPYVSTYLYYTDRVSNEEVEEFYRIRSWDSEDWIEPTVDIYERDCKKEK